MEKRSTNNSRKPLPRRGSQKNKAGVKNCYPRQIQGRFEPENLQRLQSGHPTCKGQC